MNQEKKTLLGLTLPELQEVVAAYNLPRYAASQIARWLYVRRVVSIDEMHDLSKAAREKLSASYTVGREEPLREDVSADGTKKYLFRGTHRHEIEAVYIPDKERATLCVSSQAGCRMGCFFCLTGRQGFHGNLPAALIINQILSIPDSERLTNIVFMGMGEPLDNLAEVIKAIEILTSKWGMAWSPRRITVSTVGKLDGIKELLDRTQVHLALSVHFPFATQRSRYMPVEKAFPVEKVVRLLSRYDFSRQRRCSVEYIMWEDINDSLEYADALASLLRPVNGVRVNLIRYHAIPECPDMKPADYSVMERFRDRLNALGITATIRASRGEDILAACGMLAGKHKNNPLPDSDR